MNRPDDEVAEKIIRMLDQGVQDLDGRTRERLAAARAAAMSRYRERPVPAWGLAWATGTIFQGGQHRRAHGARYAIAAGALLLVLSGIFYWQHPGQINDIAEIDVNLLTDELPINAYLDKGFDAWLKRGSR